MPTASWILVGCGYTGTRLARELLTRGHEVVGTRTSLEGCAALEAKVPGIRSVCYSLADGQLKIPEDARVVLSVPPDSSASGSSAPSPSAPDAVPPDSWTPAPWTPDRERAFAKTLPQACRLIYLSTTGVFGQGAGQEVNDDSPVAPLSERGRRRAEVEAAIAEEHTDSVSLRIPGIYGPHRGVHFRMKQNSYRLIGSAESVVSRIHVDDLIAAILLLGESPTLAHSTYVVGDEQPCSSRTASLGIAAMLGLGAPDEVSAESVSSEVRAMLGAGRRIVPRRLSALGWRAQYPSWREGVQQAHNEELLDLHSANT
ncbi:MAG: NAD-dependent epimerase/dehydratase family protein [Kofleriaceae bacterium]|nr:NAD-dependent epimerase/dehydratase family protein [Kofleriaceae bacterium]